MSAKAECGAHSPGAEQCPPPRTSVNKREREQEREVGKSFVEVG
jgi:hypothetical protein